MAATDIRVSDREPATLALDGALVFDSVAEAWRRARERLRAGRHEVLDLGGVTRVDSAGLACVLAVLAEARCQGNRLRVARVPPDLSALARVCEVEPLLGVLL